MTNSVQVWVSPEGETFTIPEDVFAATTFRKDGWPDKRIKANGKFWKWLDGQKVKVDAVMEAINAIPAEDPPIIKDSKDRLFAQAYANRIWAGQSESISRHERLGRIAAALAEQGLSMEGVEL
jgi:hypothetical protein